MPSPYLTKSDFKAAQTCPTKVYYRHLGYPTTSDSNEFMAVLAGQGYLVEALARLRYPNGRWLAEGGSVVRQAQETAAAIDGTDDVTLFEATFISQGKLARVDILAKQGNALRLIEIKSRGLDAVSGDNEPNAAFWTSRATPQIRSDWRPYLEDVTFQMLVLSELYPEATIVPTLLVLNNAQPSPVDNIQRLIAAPGRTTGGAALRELAVDLSLLIEVDVTREVAALAPEIEPNIEYYLTGLTPKLRRLGPTLSTNCRNCEYRIPDLEHNGFRACWGELADVSPHILDLYSVGTAGGRGGALANELIAQGKVSLYDIPLDALSTRDGTVGPHAERQRRQIRQTNLDEEWLDPELVAILAEVPFPLHFVDFETCSPAIPRYAGMRPFEILAFQWSCHTIQAPGKRVVHSEWLQEHDAYPNVAFVESLRERLGDDGTILVWSGHERNVLNAIKKQAARDGVASHGLAQWVERATAPHPNGRMLDLYRLATAYYYHPRMGGKATVKSVCESVWQQNGSLRSRYPEFLDDAEPIRSPYYSLPPLAINGAEAIVRNGTGAILAYGQMMGDDGQISDEDRRKWRRLLRQYCHLDTLAMVMIWEHWQSADRSR